MRQLAALIGVTLLAPGCIEDLSFLFEGGAASAEDETHPVDRGPGSDVNPDKVARAKLLWDTHCSRCHGPTAGGTDEAPALGGADWDAKTTDDHIRKIVVGGGMAAGKSARMPAHPDLATDPELLTELITIIRNMPDWHGGPAKQGS